MGDDADRMRLEALTEKERETEIFKRIERREVMKKRWEIEKKLRQAKKAERAKATGVDEPMEKKRRGEERASVKPTIEAPVAFATQPPPTQQPTTVTGGGGLNPSTTSIFGTVSDDDDDDVDGARAYFDPKERSKERKKNVENNRNDDKRSNAMALLKARREGKQRRGSRFLFYLFCI